jgi:hypothetical protein
MFLVYKKSEKRRNLKIKRKMVGAKEAKFKASSTISDRIATIPASSHPIETKE